MLLVLVAHMARGRVTMAPLYAVAGIVTMLVWQLLQIGWWVSWGAFHIDAGQLALVPPLILGVVLAYAMDGVRATRAYLVVMTVTALSAWAFAEFRDTLTQHVPIPEVFTLSSWVHFALVVGLPAGALAATTMLEALCRCVARPLAMGLAVVPGVLVHLATSSFVSLGFMTGWRNVRNQLEEYLAFALLPALAAALYGAWALRSHQLMPARPLVEMFRIWRHTEADLRAAREQVLASDRVIGELRELNAALDEAKRINDRLVAFSPLATLQTDRDGVLSFANPAAQRLFTGAQHTLEGRRLLDLVTSVDGAAGLELPPPRGFYERAVRLQTDAGERLGELILTDLLGPNGQRIGYHVLVKDVTSATQAREQQVIEARVRGIHQTGKVIAHDFGNLLLGLQSAVERAADTGEPTELARTLDAVRQGVARGREMLRELGAGQALPKPRLRSTALRALLREVVELCRPVALQRDIELALEVLAEHRVNVDATQMARVFTNLVTNAIRASPSGSRIQVATRASGTGVTVEVRDHGPGMSRDQIERAFDPGFSTKGGGTGGLGLAIAYLMVDAHGGTLTLESPPAGGLAALVWLPLASVPSHVVGDGAVLIAVADEPLALALLAEWEDGGGAATETRTLDELRAVLGDEPDAWDLLITDRVDLGRVAVGQECTILVVDGEPEPVRVVHPGRRDLAACAALRAWVARHAVANA